MMTGGGGGSYFAPRPCFRCDATTHLKICREINGEPSEDEAPPSKVVRSEKVARIPGNPLPYLKINKASFYKNIGHCVFRWSGRAN